MFNDEVVKIETDKLCAIVSDMRRFGLEFCKGLAQDVHNGELSLAGAEELFKFQESRMFGAFEVLERSGIISTKEYMELTEKWVHEANKRYYDSLHCDGVNKK